MRVLAFAAIVCLLSAAAQAGIVPVGIFTTPGTIDKAAGLASLGTDGYQSYGYNGAVYTNGTLPSYVTNFSITGYGGFDEPAAGEGYAWGGGATTISFTLAADQDFKFSLYSVSNPVVPDVNVTISGANFNGGTDLLSTASTVGLPGGWASYDVSAKAGDTVTMTVTPGTGGYQDIGAVAFAAVPEPASLCLLGLGGLGMLLRRKK